MGFEEFIGLVRGLFPSLSDAQRSRLEKMEGLYLDWNSKINVISRKDMDSFYEHHVLHSLAIACLADRIGAFEDGSTVLDLGTGGGFPGIPLAIMYPKCNFVLCDSIGKKILVAESVSRSLGLENVRAVNARAESLPGIFDYVVSRAVTSLDNFYPWVKDKYAKSIFYLKGGDVNEEISQMCRRNAVSASRVGVWPVCEWMEREFFEGKYVIRINRK